MVFLSNCILLINSINNIHRKNKIDFALFCIVFNMNEVLLL